MGPQLQRWNIRYGPGDQPKWAGPRLIIRRICEPSLRRAMVADGPTYEPQPSRIAYVKGAIWHSTHWVLLGWIYSPQRHTPGNGVGRSQESKSQRALRMAASFAIGEYYAHSRPTSSSPRLSQRHNPLEQRPHLVRLESLVRSARQVGGVVIGPVRVQNIPLTLDRIGILVSIEIVDRNVKSPTD